MKILSMFAFVAILGLASCNQNSSPKVEVRATDSVAVDSTLVNDTVVKADTVTKQ